MEIKEQQIADTKDQRITNVLLEALNWLSPERHAAFLAEGHHRRFEALATHDGLLSFIGHAQLMHDLNMRRSTEIRKLLRRIGQ